MVESQALTGLIPSSPVVLDGFVVGVYAEGLDESLGVEHRELGIRPGE